MTDAYIHSLCIFSLVIDKETMNNNLASLSAPKAPYQLLLSEDNESQLKMLKNLELSEESFYELKNLSS